MCRIPPHLPTPLTSALWRLRLDRIIDRIFEVAALVEPVVSDPSPEGNLPPSVLEAYINSVPAGSVSGSDMGPLNQVALVCCWQCVQGISQLTATLVERLPGPASVEGENPLLSVGRLQELSERFYTLLVDTVHVGAFEQAKTGFAALCKTYVYKCMCVHVLCHW